MFYVVKAFKDGTREAIKSREVTGIDNALFLEKRWEAQGYETTTTMLCTKYIEVMKLTSPKVLTRRTRQQYAHD